MNINELTDEQKSVMLARLIGESVDCTCGKPGCNVGRRIDSGHRWFVPDVKNYYDPANMPLLAKVIEWSAANMQTVSGLAPHIWFAIDFDIADFHRSMKRFADAVLETAIDGGAMEE